MWDLFSNSSSSENRSVPVLNASKSGHNLIQIQARPSTPESVLSLFISNEDFWRDREREWRQMRVDRRAGDPETLLETRRCFSNSRFGFSA